MEAMLPYFTKHYGNPSSLHAFGTDALNAVDSAREIIASKINASPDEIIFTSGGSESNNLAIRGMLSKKHVITSAIEHSSIINLCQALEKEGYEVTYLKVDREGFISLDELEEAITPETAVVSIMHANNEIGNIHDIEAIGKICRKHDVPFHTDAVQSFTKSEIDVQNISLLSLSAHKIHGPKGIGALYVKRGLKLKPQIIGGDQERGLRAGTENVPGIVGFAKAVELADDKYIHQMQRLSDKLTAALMELPGATLNGSRKRLCNNVNISFEGIEGEALLLNLDERGISASTGSACTSRSIEPSHVLLAIGLSKKQLLGSLRLTLSRYTTEDEIDYAIKNIKEALG